MQLPMAPGAGGPAKCRYCGAALRPGRAPGVCEARPCQSRMLGDRVRETFARNARAAEARQDRDRDRVRPLVAEAARRCGAADESAVVAAIVPHTSAGIGPLPTERRTAFLDHLAAIVAEAFAGTDPPDPDWLARRAAPETGDPPAIAIACIACRGRCCMLGKATHGFTTAALMALFRHRNPGAAAEDALRAYRDRLPPVSTVGGCVYQGAQGCVLPREMRADICNEYRCGPMTELARQVAAHPEAPAIAVGLRADHGNVPEGGVRLGQVVSHAGGRGTETHPDLVVPPLPGRPGGGRAR